MLWIKALHVVFMVTWFAGLFYLPRLFVYHALSRDALSLERFKIMERKLYFGIMTPGAVLTWGFGLWLLYDYAWASYRGAGWLTLKLILVAVITVYHVYCGVLVRRFARDANRHGPVYYRWLNEFPVLILFAVVCLVIVKPF